MKIKKNGKTINLTESDLKRIVKKTLNEEMVVYKDATIKFACTTTNTLKNNMSGPDSGKSIPKLTLEIFGQDVIIHLDNKASENDKAIVGAFCNKR